jgi:hypothetical protein
VAKTADPQEMARAWTHRRQRLGRAAEGPAEALREVVGVYSSHPSAPLSLLRRSASIDADGFRELEERRQAVRIHAMRGSVHLVPAEFAARLFALYPATGRDQARRLQIGGFDEATYERVSAQVLELAQEPVDAKALQQAIAVDGKLMVAVRMLAVDGRVLRLGGSLRTDSLRYVATEAWLGQPLAAADPAASLNWLAEAYLRGYGPARVEDLAWWTGANKGSAKAALRTLETVDVGGGLRLPADQEQDFASVQPLDRDQVDVLPKWDSYTMGLAPDGRQRLLDDRHLDVAYNKVNRTSGLPGDGRPLVLRGGEAVAVWSHRFSGKRMDVQVSPFSARALPARLAEPAFADVAELLGAADVKVAVG